MKLLLKIMMLLPLVALTGCSEPTDEELLEGKWTLARAYETVTVSSSVPEVTEMEGYEGQTIEFFEDGSCVRHDRSESYYYQWYLTDRHLVYADMGSVVAREEYDVSELTSSKLVYGNSYSHYDSVAHRSTTWTYTFEFTR